MERKKMKQKRWIVLIVVVLVFALSGAALILANFSAMKSQLARDSSMASSTGSGGPLAQISPDKTGLFISGDDKHVNALQRELTHLLGGQIQFGEIVLVDGMSDKAEYPLLFVTLDKLDITWSPVYAHAELEVTVSYASNGDVSFRHTTPVEFKHTSDQPSMMISGQYSLADTSWGLISNPGYVNYLAKEIAKAISADLLSKK